MNLEQIQRNKVFCRMYVLAVIAVMSNIDEILMRYDPTKLKLGGCLKIQSCRLIAVLIMKTVLKFLLKSRNFQIFIWINTVHWP